METTKSNVFDLTQGNILSKLLLVALPIMGTQFIQMTYNLTDMFWLGKLSSDALAASGTAGMYIWLSMAFLMFGRMGAEIGVAQNMGKGNVAQARGFAESSFTLAAILGFAYMAVMILARRPLIGFFGIQERQVVADTENYLWVVSLGIPFTFLSAVLSGCFSGFGNTRIPFFINLMGLIINMILDPLLIFGFDMGIWGATIATVMAQAIVCVLLIVAVKYFKNRPFEGFNLFVKPLPAHVKQIIIWGLPVAVESLLFTFLSMFISRLVATWGAGVIAVQRVGSQVESLSWLICGGFASAVTAFVGQNYGAGKWPRIHKGYKMSVGVMAVYGAAVSILMYCFAEPLMGIFLNEREFLALGGEYLRILSACQLIACIEYTTAGCFRGMGRTINSSVVSVCCNALRVPLAYVLSNTPLGLNGVWWAIAIGASLRGIWLFAWYLLDRRRMPSEDIVVME